MVWGLFPVDPLPGENEYYIFRKGTYKVGRKGCDIIINKDKGVSRVHAEIIVDEMICMDHLQKRHLAKSSKVRIRDCSKYGTFINKNLSSVEKVHEFPNKETLLKEGDLVAFGTGNAKYRFSFVSLVPFTPSSKPSLMNQLQDKMSLHAGASATQTWTSKCTHMVVDDFASVNDEIIDAIVAGKPLFTFSWIEVIAGNTICTEMPSSVLHAPTLALEGVSLKVADPQSREECLKGYTFLLVSIKKYKLKEKLQSLLDAGGAKTVCVETSDPCSQNLGDNRVCVMPAGLTSNTGIFNKFSLLPKVNEMELISAVISGHLNPSVIASAPVMVTSSCSTDETVVADSDVEMETVTSVRPFAAVNLIESAEDRKIEIHKLESSEEISRAEKTVHIIESSEHDSVAAFKTTEHESQVLLPRNQDTLKPDSPCRTAVKTDGEYITSLRNRESEGIGARKDKGIASESENLDIIYSQNLIVRDSSRPQPGHSSIDGAAIDFKCFRKMIAPSGNSFNNLIPFSKHPYDGSDYGNEDVSQSMKEEKKRKQMEAIAEDLFNYEKGRRRAAPGSVNGLFARG
ncbi:Mre11 complex subunit Nbs1 [Castilleja foliolosa]|uniref:Mre11 complex subunit Nbs1 n=1 Tax=Castilleja foliolosa TaxID=1961234 RepID=A0ABD3BZN1_9LAMI